MLVKAVFFALVFPGAVTPWMAVVTNFRKLIDVGITYFIEVSFGTVPKPFAYPQKK